VGAGLVVLGFIGKANAQTMRSIPTRLCEASAEQGGHCVYVMLGFCFLFFIS